MSRCLLALTFPGCSVPPTGPGLAGRRVEVAGLLDPGAAFGLDLVVPGDVQPVARAARRGTGNRLHIPWNDQIQAECRARIWSFQGMCSRLPVPRRAASLPVSIQS